MNSRPYCLAHSGICGGVEDVKEDIKIEKTDRVKEQETIWTAIDGIRRMYYSAMVTFIVTCLGVIGYLFAKTMHWL